MHKTENWFELHLPFLNITVLMLESKSYKDKSISKLKIFLHFPMSSNLLQTRY